MVMTLKEANCKASIVQRHSRASIYLDPKEIRRRRRRREIEEVRKNSTTLGIRQSKWGQVSVEDEDEIEGDPILVPNILNYV